MPEDTKQHLSEITHVGELSRVARSYVEIHNRASTLAAEIMRPYLEVQRALPLVAAQVMGPYLEMQRTMPAIATKLMEPYLEMQRNFADAAEAMQEFAETQRHFSHFVATAMEPFLASARLCDKAAAAALVAEIANHAELQPSADAWRETRQAVFANWEDERAKEVIDREISAEGDFDAMSLHRKIERLTRIVESQNGVNNSGELQAKIQSRCAELAVNLLASFLYPFCGPFAFVLAMLYVCFHTALSSKESRNICNLESANWKVHHRCVVSSRPARNGRTIGHLEAGEFVQVSGKLAGWLQVEFIKRGSFVAGWVKAKYLKRV